MLRTSFVGLFLLSGAALAASDDPVQQALITCTSAGQTVSYEVLSLEGDAGTATADEDQLVKEVLTKSNLPFDKVNNRKTYEAALAMVRIKTHLFVTINPSTASAAFDKTRQCIEELIKRSEIDGSVAEPASESAPNARPIAVSCTATGAFGIEFGSIPNKLGPRVRRSLATDAHYITPPQPDLRFDRYEVLLDKTTREVVSIEAIKKTGPDVPSSRAATGDEIAEGIRKAAAFVEDYFDSLPQDVQKLLGEPDHSGGRKGNVTPAVSMNILSNSTWTASVVCRDEARFGAAVRREWR